jgi:sugar/nucleoside kinase (ribokinase family)
MNTYLGASEQLTGREIDEAALVESEWLYIEGYLLTDDARAALIKDVVAKAKESGVKVALSLSDPFVAQIFADNLRAVIGEGVDLVFCNKDEALAFTKTETVDEACEALKQSAKTFAVTDGAQGAIVFDGKDTVSVPCVPVDAVDTNGAGDMFAGAFMYALTAGRDFKWAAELANESAARVVGQFGPRLDAIEFDSIKQTFGI